MSSVLVVDVGDGADESLVFRLLPPTKGIIAQRYYDHDGSLGGSPRVVNAQDLHSLLASAYEQYANVREDREAARLLAALSSEDVSPYADLSWET